MQPNQEKMTKRQKGYIILLGADIAFLGGYLLSWFLESQISFQMPGLLCSLYGFVVGFFYAVTHGILVCALTERIILPNLLLLLVIFLFTPIYILFHTGASYEDEIFKTWIIMQFYCPLISTCVSLPTKLVMKLWKKRKCKMETQILAIEVQEQEERNQETKEQ